MIDGLLMVVAGLMLWRAEAAMNRMRAGQSSRLMFLTAWMQAVSSAWVIFAVMFDPRDLVLALLGMVATAVAWLCFNRRSMDRVLESLFHKLDGHDHPRV